MKMKRYLVLVSCLLSIALLLMGAGCSSTKKQEPLSFGSTSFTPAKAAASSKEEAEAKRKAEERAHAIAYLKTTWGDVSADKPIPWQVKVENRQDTYFCVRYQDANRVAQAVFTGFYTGGGYTKLDVTAEELGTNPKELKDFHLATASQWAKILEDGLKGGIVRNCSQEGEPQMRKLQLALAIRDVTDELIKTKTIMEPVELRPSFRSENLRQYIRQGLVDEITIWRKQKASPPKNYWDLADTSKISEAVWQYSFTAKELGLSDQEFKELLPGKEG